MNATVVNGNKHSYKPWCEVQIPLGCNCAGTCISTTISGFGLSKIITNCTNTIM